ncbi:hypothetical protein [Asticcacaulis endophyticus]|uniref:Uncharacterized protein n=1 Tax=Asticcacaulis endophyticus TaxID=1395890 RepID=A0A918Q3J0_9CAUL|nr:hypothetical protein [Asticcacaulis endophyticus]GGZ32625.1 hypothetical protein GCM10011273_18500 [Asticcacaulis endophyticus]
MDGPTVALIVGIGTIMASGVMSSVVTYHLNRNRTQTIFLREKAEQLYLSADEFGKSFAAQVITYYPLLDGKIDYNQMLDMQIEHGKSDKKYGGAETMTMLVEIYFPSVRPALEDVWKAREGFNKITSDIKLAWQANGHVNQGGWKLSFANATNAINSSINALQRQIVVAARVHAGVKQ